MKTFEGKTITKKHVREALRTKDPTKIWHLVHLMNGGKTTREQVYYFIYKYATDAYADKYAYLFAYRANTTIHVNKWLEYAAENGRHVAMEGLRVFLSAPIGPYSKKPLIGRTHLYFCSPIYGLEDYNKWRSIPIEGNEDFCRLIVAVANKHN